MSGDDEIFGATLATKFIGWLSRCPHCTEIGVIDDIRDGDVVIRHDADTWHVSPRVEASRILWVQRLLRSAPKPLPSATPPARRR